MAGTQRSMLAGPAAGTGQLAHDIHLLPALGGLSRLAARVRSRAERGGLAHAAGRLDHGASPPAHFEDAQKNGPQALGRSRGGLTTKLHVAAHARGRPVRGRLSTS